MLAVGNVPGMAVSNKDNPTSGAGKSAAPAATNPQGVVWRELDDRGLRNAAVDRGITTNEATPEDLIAALEAYDRDGSQGADAPADNHPATIEQRAAEDEKRRSAQNG